MKVMLYLLKRLNAKIINQSFIMYQLFWSRLDTKRNLKILFSNKEDWKSFIKKGFQFTSHKIYFSELSSENFQDYDLVVPLTISDLKYLNDKGNLIKHNPIPIPSIQTIQLCDDKYLFNESLIDMGFGDFVPKMGITRAYPYIVKKRIDAWGENSHIISDEQQEGEVAEILNHPEYFTQELVPGPTEYATHIFFKNQKVVCSINIKYVFEKGTPIKGKDKVIYEKICHCPYLDLFSSMLMAIGFEGICCFNYKVYDDRPFIIEINPRFGGSLCPYFFSFAKHFN